MGKAIVTGVKYSKKEVLTIYNLFKSYDVNNDGKVTAKELSQAMKRPDIHRLPMNESAFIRSMDVNKDGILTFDEVLVRYYPAATSKELKAMYLWAYPVTSALGAPPPDWEPTKTELDEIRSMFLLYDANKNGVLEWKEVQDMAKKTGYDEFEVDALFRGADLNGDDTIGFDEFVQMVKYSYI
ncbi:hypothetical protein FOA52_014451 [Chlamydomonas sp. UWO 241]|nr:hypothetical protein FOA52_014451 [Chlamydomonas sp. UWO 241]